MQTEDPPRTVWILFLSCIAFGYGIGNGLTGYGLVVFILGTIGMPWSLRKLRQDYMSRAEHVESHYRSATDEEDEDGLHEIPIQRNGAEGDS